MRNGTTLVKRDKDGKVISRKAAIRVVGKDGKVRFDPGPGTAEEAAAMRAELAKAEAPANARALERRVVPKKAEE